MTETAALQAKENGLPLWKLPIHQDAKRAAQILLFDRLQTISGVPMPKGEDYFVVAAEVYSFLVTTPAFSRLTMDEIITAFRLNASGSLPTSMVNGKPENRVEHFNSIINCDYVGKVLERYAKVRQSLENKIEQAVPSAHQIENDPEANSEVLIKTVKDVFYKTGLTGLIPTKVYDLLIASQELELLDEEKKEIRTKVEARLENEALTEGINAIRDFKLLKQNNRDYEIKVRNECKRQAVAIYFAKQKLMDDF